MARNGRSMEVEKEKKKKRCPKKEKVNLRFTVVSIQEPLACQVAPLTDELRRHVYDPF